MCDRASEVPVGGEFGPRRRGAGREVDVPADLGSPREKWRPVGLRRACMRKGSQLEGMLSASREDRDGAGVEGVGVSVARADSWRERPGGMVRMLECLKRAKKRSGFWQDGGQEHK